MDNIASAYATTSKYTISKVYLNEAVFGSESMLFGLLASRKISDEAFDEKGQMKEDVITSLKTQAEAFYDEVNPETDQKLFAVTMKMFSENVPEDQQPQAFKDAVKKYKGNFDKMAETFYKKSAFNSYDEFAKFMDDKPSQKDLDKDPVYSLSQAMPTNYRQNIVPKSAEAEAKMVRAERLLVRGLREMNPKKVYAPDANFTMRLSYGNVHGYEPRDAVFYQNMTTLEGMMAKEDPNDEEFIVPAKLKELYQKKDYGKYGVNGMMPLNFLTNNDITGGNSGSPVINGKGQLIGCAFDGNWEAMSGDIAFETQLQRTISVDIRYILFIVDKYAGAGHLIKEMDLVFDDKAMPNKSLQIADPK